MKHKDLLRLLITGITIVVLSVLVTSTASAKALPDIQGTSAVLMDVETGEVLYAKNKDLRRPPASTTKIITGLMALEFGDLGQVVDVSEKAASAEGSSVWLRPGEKQRLSDLVYGIMLGSGNDAARAIAETISGSEEKFAQEMTKKAQQLGAKNTQFRNASGLPDDGHYSTVYDMALLTRYALNNKEFSRIIQTRSHVLPGNDLQKERQIYNHNKLLWRYQYADGVKTGYTRQAGRCLVSSATKDERRLVAVVFNSKAMYEDCQKMLEYGFEEFRLVSLDEQKFRDVVPVRTGLSASVEAIPGKEIKAVVPAEDLGKVRVETILAGQVDAPVSRLQNVGEVKLFVGDRLIETAPLLAVEDVLKDTLLTKIFQWFKRVFGR